MNLINLTSYSTVQVISIWFILSLLLCLAICWAGAKWAAWSDYQHYRTLKKKADLMAEIDARNSTCPDDQGHFRTFFR